MLTSERLRSILEYDPVTGVFIRIAKTGRNTVIGRPVGSLDRYGYLQCSIDNRKYKMHRLVFLLADGEFPAEEVDHIDGNPANNAQKNLRKVSRVQNMQNMSLRNESKTSVKNVYFDKRCNKYAVRIRVKGSRRSFGLFEDLELARLVATEARNKYHGEYARHE